MKKLLALLTLIISSLSGFSQWRYVYSTDADHNHYSIEAAGGEASTVMAGTIFSNGSLGDNKTHVVMLDNSGNQVWERQFDLGEDERCFDVFTSDDEILVTGYVLSDEVSKRVPFLLILDFSGNFLNYRELQVSGEADEEGVGLDVLYSAVNESYFVAGYTSLDVKDVQANKKALLIKLDASLTFVWAQEIYSAANEYDMANDLTEIPGAGVYITGMVERSSNSQTGSLHALFDYSGSLVWNLSSESTNSHQTGVDAVYDEGNDILYTLNNNSVMHTFQIDAIQNASLSTASMLGSWANNLANDLSHGPFNNINNVAGYSIELRGEEELAVAGMTQYMDYNNRTTYNVPTFIASVNRSGGAVNWLRYIETMNQGSYADHDIDMFQAFYWQQAIINFPDIMCVTDAGEGDNYHIVGYETRNSFIDLVGARTDNMGNIDPVEACQVSNSSTGNNRTPAGITIDFNDLDVSVPDFEPQADEPNHQLEEECFDFPDCEVSVNYTSGYVDCYKYWFDATSIAGNGTIVIDYLWDWGDGSFTYSVTGQDTHQFSSSACSYTVCVSVRALGPKGDTCTDTICAVRPMLVFPGCGSCGTPKWGGEESGASIASVFKVYPNPTEGIVTVDLGGSDETVQVRLMDVSGRTVKNFVNVRTNDQLSLDGLESGNYFLHVRSANESFTEQVIIH